MMEMPHETRAAQNNRPHLISSSVLFSMGHMRVIWYISFWESVTPIIYKCQTIGADNVVFKSKWETHNLLLWASQWCNRRHNNNYCSAATGLAIKITPTWIAIVMNWRGECFCPWQSFHTVLSVHFLLLRFPRRQLSIPDVNTPKYLPMMFHYSVLTNYVSGTM